MKYILNIEFDGIVFTREFTSEEDRTKAIEVFKASFTGLKFRSREEEE